MVGRKSDGGGALTELSDVTGNSLACAEHEIVEQLTAVPDLVTVTAALRLNVQIKQGSDSYTAIGTYNFNEGNEYALDMGAGEVTGKVTSYGVTLQLYNHAGRGFKGIEYPTGDITFELELSTMFVPTSGNPELTDEQQAEIMENYTPLVLSWGPQSDSVYDGRTLTDITILYASAAAPGNSGMREAWLTTGSSNCYNGGTWAALKEDGESTISITVSDYEILYPLFPNADYGSGVTASTYYSRTTGLQNIGCFSAGKFFILTPFYNNKTGDYILEDYGLTDGTFLTTIRDVKLNATSVSGQSLEEVNDNSNQMVTTDDSVSATVYLARPGSYVWRVAWTKFGSYDDNLRFSDVLGRGYATAGSWYQNGQDVLVIGSDVAIGSGVVNNENTDSSNRLYAADILCKFDGDAVTLTGAESVVARVATQGFEVTFLYATKPNGQNWASDAEMNAAQIEDLVYYSSLAEAQAAGTVVAYLTEYRPIDNDPSKISKNRNGSLLLASVGATVNTDLNLVGNVYQCVIGGKLWRVSEWEAAVEAAGGDASKAIPSMAGHHPETNYITLPEATITSYMNYTKESYDDSGNVKGTHTGSNNYGDSLLIVNALTSISKSVAQTESDGSTKSIYQLDNGQRYVDYVLQPGFTGMPDGVSTVVDTLTITDTLAAGLTYVDGSAYLGGSYTQSDTQGQMGTVEGGERSDPTVVENADGSTTLTWVLRGVSTDIDESELVIHYSAEIGTEGNEDTDVEDGETLNNTATITCTGDMRAYNASNGNLASVNIVVSKLERTALSKVANPQRYDPGDDMTFTLNVANQSESVMADTVILDNLPYDGDTRGSSFSGSLTVTAVALETESESFTNWREWVCFYTTDEAARDTISSQYTAVDIIAGTSTIDGQTVTWTQATINADGSVTDIPSDGSVTAIAWVGNLSAGEVFRATVTLRTEEALAGDVIVNGLSRGNDQTIARVYIAERSIAGLTWLDSDEDGQQDSGEALLEGIRIELLRLNDSGVYEAVQDVSGNEVYVETAFGTEDDTATYTIASTNNQGEAVQITISATAASDGSYEFSGLPAGTYAVRFSSSDAVSLGKFIASPVDQGSDYTDSDGVPSYSDGGQESTTTNELVYTQITDIELPTAENLTTAYYSSRYHDSGFYYKQGSVTIKKLDDDGESLAGVVFKLEKLNDEGTWVEISAQNNTTDADGGLIYEGLYPGEYRLTEVSTLAGYTLLAEPVLITIPYASNTAEGAPSYTENGTNYYLNLTCVIENSQTFTMPNTGASGSDWRLYLTLGGSIVCLAALVLAASTLHYKRHPDPLRKPPLK